MEGGGSANFIFMGAGIFLIKNFVGQGAGKKTLPPKLSHETVPTTPLLPMAPSGTFPTPPNPVHIYIRSTSPFGVLSPVFVYSKFQGSVCPLQGSKSPNLGKEGFGVKKPISCHPRKGRSEPKNPHFYTGHSRKRVSFLTRNTLF